MSKFLILILVILSTKFSLANYSTDFKNNWDTSGKIITNIRTEESLEVQARYIKVGNDIFPVENITNSRTPQNRFKAEFKTVEAFVEIY